VNTWFLGLFEAVAFIDSFCPKKAKLLLIVGKIESN
jgi:hypothetical protein